VGFRDRIRAETASFLPKVIILIRVFEGIKSAAFKACLPALRGAIIMMLCKRREIRVL
jgi:hypothetical protein